MSNSIKGNKVKAPIMTAPPSFPPPLDTLDTLSDDQLQAVIARAQALLLDRPVPPDASSSLAVEIVG